MPIAIHDIDMAGLSPIQKMELADVLYDTAQQEFDALTAPLTPEQLREIDRRLAAADQGTFIPEPWEVLMERIRQAL